MAGFTKLYGSIVNSSVWSESKETKILWITMLAMADADGFVHAALPGLARAADLTIPETEQALAVLMAPDKYSRTPSNEGRRVEEAGGGWLILNHTMYREMRTLRQEQGAERVRRHRARAKQEKPGDIYVAQMRGTSTFKVGFSTNAGARVVELQTGCPQPLDIVFLAPATMREERDLHALLADKRVHGEWYEGDIVPLVERYCNDVTHRRQKQKTEAEADTEEEAEAEAEDPDAPQDGPWPIDDGAVADARRARHDPAAAAMGTWTQLASLLAHIPPPNGKRVRWGMTPPKDFGDVLDVYEAKDLLAYAQEFALMIDNGEQESKWWRRGMFTPRAWEVVVNVVDERRARRDGPPEKTNANRSPAELFGLGEITREEYERAIASKEN